MPDIFLKFDPEIQGGSDNFKFAKYIVIESFSWGVSNAPFDGKDDLPAVQQTLNLVGPVDRQSPKLFEASAQGKPFEAAELSVVSEGGDQQLFYKVVVSGVLISSYQVGGASSTVGLTEQYALSFRTLENKFFPQRPDGTLEPAITGIFDFGAPIKP
jgi:type VI protein secretion system component Hcp